MGNSQSALPDSTCTRFVKSKLLKSNFTKLLEAVKVGNINVVRYLHSKHVNFNQTLRNGDTLVHIAVKFGRLAIVKFLADNVPQLNFNDRSVTGDTPVMIAVMNGDIRIIEYLVLKKGVDLNIAENRGFTPFMAACANGNIHIVEFLVKHGANFKAKAKDGQTGLHRAAFYGNKDVLRYLIINLNMNVLIADKKGYLPLHLACMKVSFSCVRILIRASGLSVIEQLHTPNQEGTKPIDILVRVLNKLRDFDEPKEFQVEQIEEYIRDKRNCPIIKREMSPRRSKSRSPTAFERLKSVFTFRDPTPAGDMTPSHSHHDSTPNESFIAIKPIDTTTINDRRPDEELFKYSKVTNETVSDVSPVLPLLMSKLHSAKSLEILDTSPKAALLQQSQNTMQNQSILREQKSVKFADEPSIEIKRRPPRISTDIPRVSLRLTSQGTYASQTPDEMKNISGSFMRTMKSKFSSPIKIVEARDNL